MNSKKLLVPFGLWWTRKKAEKAFRGFFPVNWFCWWKFLCRENTNKSEFKNNFRIHRLRYPIELSEFELRGLITEQFIPLNSSERINWISHRPTMRSLVRLLIGFVLIHQLPLAVECKVIRQHGHEKEISWGELNYERLDAMAYALAMLGESRVALNGTSIKYTNATKATPSGFNVNALTHVWVTECFSLSPSVLLFRHAQGRH